MNSKVLDYAHIKFDKVAFDVRQIEKEYNRALTVIEVALLNDLAYRIEELSNIVKLVGWSFSGDIGQSEWIDPVRKWLEVFDVRQIEKQDERYGV